MAHGRPLVTLWGHPLRGADAEEGPDEALRCPGHESPPCLRSCSPSDYLFRAPCPKGQYPLPALLPAPPGTERSSRCCVTSPRCRRRRSARSRPQRRASAPPSRTLPRHWAARTAGCETTCPCCRRGRRSSSRRRRGECRSPEVRVWARARDGAGRDELVRVGNRAPRFTTHARTPRGARASASRQSARTPYASRRIAGSGTHVLFVSYYVAA